MTDKQVIEMLKEFCLKVANCEIEDQRTEKAQQQQWSFAEPKYPQDNDNTTDENHVNGVIDKFEFLKNSNHDNMLKISFLLEGQSKPFVQWYTFTPKAITYLKKQFLEPMGVTLFNNNSTPEQCWNYLKQNTRKFINKGVSIERERQKNDSRYFNMIKCEPNEEFTMDDEIPF